MKDFLFRFVMTIGLLVALAVTLAIFGTFFVWGFVAQSFGWGWWFGELITLVLFALMIQVVGFFWEGMMS